MSSRTEKITQVLGVSVALGTVVIVAASWYIPGLSEFHAFLANAPYLVYGSAAIGLLLMFSPFFF